MAQSSYCWLCKKDVPMLDDAEWQRVEPLLGKDLENLKQYRLNHGVSLDEALASCPDQPGFAKYVEITGHKDTTTNALWHHRLSLIGPPCEACGRPLRTPTSKRCFECHATKT